MSEMTCIMTLWEFQTRLLANMAQRCLRSTTGAILLRCTRGAHITVFTKVHLEKQGRELRLKTLAALAESLGSILNIHMVVHNCL